MPFDSLNEITNNSYLFTSFYIYMFRRVQEIKTSPTFESEKDELKTILNLI